MVDLLAVSNNRFSSLSDKILSLPEGSLGFVTNETGLNCKGKLNSFLPMLYALEIMPKYFFTVDGDLPMLSFSSLNSAICLLFNFNKVMFPILCLHNKFISY